MHGRKKVKETPELLAMQKAKTLKYQALKSDLIRLKRQRDKQITVAAAKVDGADGDQASTPQPFQFNAELLTTLGKLLYISPDFSTLWNLRREVFLHLVEGRKAQSKGDAASDAAALRKDVEREFQVTEDILTRRDFKSYGTWHHRLWIVERYLADDLEALQEELELTAQVISYDLRNFHCWNYRKSMLAMIYKFEKKHAKPEASPPKEEEGDGEQAPPASSGPEIPKAEVEVEAEARISEKQKEEELAFLTQLFARNPSNYSAWHNKSLLISRPEQLEAEFKQCIQMFYTDPEDSSAWIFHRFLFQQEAENVFCGKEASGSIQASPKKEEAEGESEVVDPKERLLGRLRESKYCLDLLDVVEDKESKWPRVTILQNLSMMLDDPRLPYRSDMESRKVLIEATADVFRSHLPILMKVDSKRFGFYRDLRSDLKIKLGCADLITTKEIAFFRKGLTRFNAVQFYPNLTKVDFHQNSIRRIPRIGRHCPRLEVMLLSENHVSEMLPDEIGSFVSLKVLDLRKNEVSYVQPDLLLSSTLEELNISGNPIHGQDWKASNFPALCRGDALEAEAEAETEKEEPEEEGKKE